MLEKLSLGEKLKNACKKVGDFFIGLFNVASYDAQTEAVNTSLTNFSAQLNTIATNLQANTTATSALSTQINNLNTEITKIKDGLQIELFGSLQALHTKLMDQRFATVDQKREAELYYTQIHNLGKDGWSEKYYKEIIEMPESREEYWKTIGNNG